MPDNGEELISNPDTSPKKNARTRIPRGRTK